MHYDDTLHIPPPVRAKPNKYTNFNDNDDNKSMDGHLGRYPDYTYAQPAKPKLLQNNHQHHRFHKNNPAPSIAPSSHIYYSASEVGTVKTSASSHIYESISPRSVHSGIKSQKY